LPTLDVRVGSVREVAVTRRQALLATSSRPGGFARVSVSRAAAGKTTVARRWPRRCCPRRRSSGIPTTGGRPPRQPAHRRGAPAADRQPEHHQQSRGVPSLSRRSLAPVRSSPTWPDGGPDPGHPAQDAGGAHANRMILLTTPASRRSSCCRPSSRAVSGRLPRVPMAEIATSCPAGRGDDRRGARRPLAGPPAGRRGGRRRGGRAAPRPLGARLNEVFGAPADVALGLAAELDAATSMAGLDRTLEDPVLFAWAPGSCNLRRRMIDEPSPAQGRWPACWSGPSHGGLPGAERQPRLPSNASCWNAESELTTEPQEWRVSVDTHTPTRDERGRCHGADAERDAAPSHASVEAAMRAYARGSVRRGPWAPRPDPRWTTRPAHARGAPAARHAHAPERGWPDEIIQDIAPRRVPRFHGTPIRKALHAVDEMCGFVIAPRLVSPTARCQRRRPARCARR